MTLEERNKKALDLHSQGYNCAQCVILAFSDITELDPEIAARLAMGLGGGVGAQGEICGVITGMAITDGLTGSSQPAEKPKANKRVRALTQEFASRNKNYIRCMDLKAKCGRSCNSLITDGVEILTRHLSLC